jgi:hypothetical protein
VDVVFGLVVVVQVVVVDYFAVVVVFGQVAVVVVVVLSYQCSLN